MKETDRAYCPFCSGEILSAAFFCKHCGRDLHAMRIAYHKGKSVQGGPYEVVPDGVKYGIALRSEVVLHGMERDEAQSTARILNSVMDADGAGEISL